jgi:hypothetical protein
MPIWSAIIYAGCRAPQIREGHVRTAIDLDYRLLLRFRPLLFLPGTPARALDTAVANSIPSFLIS